MAIFILTGSSGSGKTSLAHQLKEQEFWNECISHTTRPMRNGEKNGEVYYFVTSEEFNRMLEDGELIERVEYDGNSYGISRAEMERVMTLGKHIYIIAEYGGYVQIKERFPEAIGIFIYMSKEECMENMLLRGDDIDKATKRIELYDEELEKRTEFDYVVKNVKGSFAETISILRAIGSQYY